jgi:tetratricopeptide (TPR) repeat protein
MIDAVQNTPRTPEMDQGFAQLVEAAEGDLAKGAYQDALDKYKRVVPFQPTNGRAKAGMAWSMVRLNKQPMADNVWNVAAQDPAAIDALGDTLKAKGDADGAKQVWQRLAQTVPSYAAKLSGKQ